MPDAAGNIKGISTTGIKNRWLEELEAKKKAEREKRRKKPRRSS